MSDALGRQRVGLWSVLLAALLFGIGTPLAKGLLGEIPPLILAGLFYLGSGIGLTILTWSLRRGVISQQASLTRADFPWLSGAIMFGGILAPVLLLTGLLQTPASNASLLLNLEGVFTVILACIAFHENIDRKFALGVGAVLSGSVLVSWQGVEIGGGFVGPVAIAMACLCWGIDNNLTQKVSAGDPVQIAAIKGLVAGSVNLSLGISLQHSFSALAWVPAALVIGFFSYGLSVALFVLALRNLGTARTGAYFSTAPFIGAILSVIILREMITASLVAAALTMTVGIWLLLTEKHAHPHFHDALDHSHPHMHDEHHQHEHGPHDPPGEPHVHSHEHVSIAHSHPHRPDIHHRHSHDPKTVNQE